MVFACGLSNYSVGVFHLANHAFFKALLFLGAGSVIHAVADEQDMRRMGGLKRLVPFTFVVMSIGSFALMGFPFLTGFYSKDVILEVAYVAILVRDNLYYEKDKYILQQGLNWAAVKIRLKKQAYPKTDRGNSLNIVTSYTKHSNEYDTLTTFD